MTSQATVGAEGFGRFVKRWGDWLLGVGVLALVLTLIVPVSTAVLDLLVAINIASGILVLLATTTARSASELSTFPSILLFSTLFRLGLNVASTRSILTHGEAGAIIKAFGDYVGGDNLVVGLVVFLILIIIQFVVITKGAGRISEVAARFVLDAMPGKQMAIDADISSGVIDGEEGKRRRQAVASEAEFYGAMDGASKFVRGDAIAGLIITALNLLGGIAFGVFKGMDIGAATDRYSKLTIGDGLVSQIPALLVSTAAAVLVTKNSNDATLGPNLVLQIGGRPRATLIAAGMLAVIGLMPGLPALPFFVLATVLLVVWNATRGSEVDGERRTAPAKTGAAGAAGPEAAAKPENKPVDELLQVDRIGLEIGYRLIPFVGEGRSTGILEHISQLRRRFASREGVVLPPVRVQDNIRLAPNAYRILVGGNEIARGEVEATRFLAMDGGATTRKIQGTPTKDPTFGLPALWIDEAQRDEAELAGYTVIDPVSVLATHLAETLRGSLGDILSRDDVKELVDSAKKHAPAVVEELVPAKMGYGDVQRALRGLLREGVSIRNLPVILEALADQSGKTKDPDQLVEHVRARLARALCETHADATGCVHAVTLDPDVESKLSAAVTNAKDPEAAAVNPAWLQKLMERTASSVAQAERSGRSVVILARSNVRRFLAELARSSLPKVAVLSYNEVASARAVETAGVVRMGDGA